MLVLWLCCLAFVLTCLGLYKIVSSFTNLLFKEKKPKITDPLNTYKESHALDQMIQGNPLEIIDSISQRYETVIASPLDYTEEEREETAKEYRELLIGEIKDPEAYHAPNERREGYLNTDYIRYLKNQSKALGPDCWHKKELERIQQIEQEEQIGIDFRYELMKMGAVSALVHAMTSEERMETYTTNDWRDLITATNKYAARFRLDRIIHYLKEVQNKEALLDKKKMELFDLLLEKEVPEKIAGVFVTTELEEEELTQTLELLDQKCTIEEALGLVLTNKMKELESNLARKKLNAMIL